MAAELGFAPVTAERGSTAMMTERRVRARGEEEGGAVPPEGSAPQSSETSQTSPPGLAASTSSGSGGMGGSSASANPADGGLPSSPPLAAMPSGMRRQTNSLYAMLDPKLVERPACFDGIESGWPEWRFKLMSWLSLVDIRYPDMLAACEQVDVPTLQGEHRRLQVILYVLLASLTTGRLNHLVRNTENENGFSAWRAIVREMEPHTAQRRIAMLTTLLRPDLGDETVFEREWMKWETEIAQYEKVEGKQFDRQLMHALVLEQAPEDIRKQLQFFAPSDYNQLRDMLKAYLGRRRSWTAQLSLSASPPMEVDIVTKGSSKGGGTVCFNFQKNGECKYGNSCRYLHQQTSSSSSRGGGGGERSGPKSTGTFGGVCYVCGRRGHRAAECSQRHVEGHDASRPEVSSIEVTEDGKGFGSATGEESFLDGSWILS
mmetsp:Transcript_79651/g.202916  ORF Transcript_79651/g.202916 Transcript_79651/m.202916 type:complete len:431 (+) Transcript_79651:287-1579(+)